MNQLGEHGNALVDRGIRTDLRPLRTQGDVVRHLASTVPQNEYGMPQGIFRPDMLPLEDIDYFDYGEETTAVVANAYVPLDFSEGYPVTPDGLPVWSRFDYEPVEAFHAFECYLRFEERSFARRLKAFNETQHTESPEVELAAAAGRQLNLIPDMLKREFGINLPLGVVVEYSKMFYWGVRAKAHDVFRAAAHKREMSLRAMDTVDLHYLQSQKIFRKLMVYMDDDEEFWELMTPKIAVDLLKTVTSMQRMSAGLSPNSVNSDNEGGFTSMELLLRTAAQKHSGPVIEAEGSANDSELLTRIQGDENALAKAQELLIQISAK